MKVRDRTVVLLVAVVATGTFAFALAPGRTGPATAGAACGTESVRGLYAMSGAGTLFGAPLATVGTVTFDGAGRLTGSHVDSTGGLVTRSTLDGRYAVDGTCRGTATFTHHHEPQAGDRSLGETLDEHVFELAVSDGGARVAWLLVSTTPSGAPGSSPGPGPDVAVNGSFERS